MLSPRNLEEPGYQSPRNLKETGNIDVFIAYRTSDAEKFISWNARWMERSQPLRRTGLIQEECQKPDFGRKGTLDEVTNRLPKLVFSISLTAGLRFSRSSEETKFIHAVRCGLVVPGTTFHNDSKQFFVVSRRFLDNSFLDDSWTWSAFEQFLGETSWFFGWET
ncbi:hypothetical protein GLOIN_2v1786977 [Rhizophagus irregularis DAOM 181602=DAOM 197198]|uniref:TIR domain-containing protein n=1 Tax=Rhizophagus irregularis (strain DAOM 181602 / DAOM 197198 / MUCL 43194) TaxID=747089 RepID=A0A2P4P6V5_RHIID|nr:hypothetical protein GLOIN_2v1786977 [Rhizophagus irregularis DAOM 181602=DAOM 197198]POG61115.1 hypothetical protein GLOIN_2v1786977 [Rhizophagus irregularis DAOM 181602=DAOM 197198]|eukprot:XP_025167981.1 hypothetical protein GLOIN_2v1786977 [Rhizophagus irregularis DAOM 181602=DAOM 197198]